MGEISGNLLLKNFILLKIIFLVGVEAAENGAGHTVI